MTMLKQIAERLRVATDDDTPGLDTRVKPVVRIINGALDEDDSSSMSIKLNGRIDPATLRFLKVDSSYQRPLGERADIFEALKNGVVVPNIDIGVRGQDFTTDGDDFLIRSPAYIIDGWQRVGNARRLLELIPNHPIRMFATVHFGTDDLWERHRFTELNKNVRRVSANLHLRNMRDSNRAVATLYGLSNSTREFPLYEKVCWSQNLRRGELVPALTLTKVAMRLHSHLGGVANGTVELITAALLRSADKAKLDTFRKNVTTFFDVVEECWGIQKIEYRHNAPQIKAQFMLQLARMFSLHIDFWDPSDRVFFVSANLRRKLATFPLDDPHVKNLAGSGGAGALILYDLMLNHVNSGKRTGRLQPRSGKSA
jgi:hypothetical protein